MKYQCKIFLFVLAIVGFSSGFASQAFAPSSQKEEPAARYHQTKRGDWITRLRALYLLPFSSSSSVSSIPNSGVKAHPGWTGEFDFGYMFTQNLGSELILATSYHTLWGTKSLQGTKIGSAWLLPPTLTLQVRLLPKSIIQPYLGGGVNYTVFYGKHCNLANTSLHLNPSWGGAVQAGIDYFFFRDWLFNVDVKYIWIHTDARLHGGVNGKVHVNINPLAIGFGFGRKW